MAKSKYKPSEEEALSRLQQLCSTKECCKYDLIQKLTQWGIENGSKILERLEEDKFLDERRYASAFVNDKWKFGKWGRHKIAYALRGKKISGNFIEEAFENIDEEAYAEMIRQEIEKKKKSIKEPDAFKLKQKLFRFAQSRGYELELVNTMVVGE